MDFFNRNKKIIVTLFAVFLLITSFFTVGKKVNANLADNAISIFVIPFQKAGAAVSDFFGQKTAFLKNAEELEKENQKLKQELEIALSENQRLSLYEQENEKLSELLEISQKYTKYDTTALRIIGKDPSNWFETFTLDKGKKDGITSDTVLIASGGLVGRVYEAGNSYSKAQSIIESTSSVAAVSLRTNDIGVVKGDYALNAQGLCKMEYIDSSAEIIVGDEIVTSSLSDIYPPGICIGYVKEIKTDSNGLTKYAIIEPQADLKHLDTLLALNYTKEGEE